MQEAEIRIEPDKAVFYFGDGTCITVYDEGDNLITVNREDGGDTEVVLRSGEEQAQARTLGTCVAGERLVLGDDEYTVAEKCATGGSNGRWACVNHGEVFQHNFAKDTHISRGTHVLSWVCFTHGPEVP